MSFLRVSLLLLLFDGISACGREWDCEKCVFNGCNYLVIGKGKPHCVDNGVEMADTVQKIRHVILCGFFNATFQVKEEKQPMSGSISMLFGLHERQARKKLEPSPTRKMIKYEDPTTSNFSGSSTVLGKVNTSLTAPLLGETATVARNDIPRWPILVGNQFPPVPNTTIPTTRAPWIPLQPRKLNSFPTLPHRSTVPTTTAPPPQPHRVNLTEPPSRRDLVPTTVQPWTIPPAKNVNADTMIANKSLGKPTTAPFSFKSTSKMPSTGNSTLGSATGTGASHSPMMAAQQLPMDEGAFFLYDKREFFTTFPFSHKCDKETRNETLLFQYASALCNIEKLQQRKGITTLDNLTKGWILLNPAKRFPATCAAVRHAKRKCRVNFIPTIRPFRGELTYGPPSTFFSSIDSSHKCDKLVIRESPAERLARTICLSGDIFLEIVRLNKINNYDLAFGMSNISHRYQLKCQSLYYRKRHCYSKKQ